MSSQDVSGLVVVDKAGGWTSHDVVARVRRLAGTRKVGHAGTLDPMATGVLVLGLGRATRLLGYLAATDKAYDATIRLGQATVTDDAEGDVEHSASAAAIDEAQIQQGVAALTGSLMQVPSKVSAVKVEGERAYRLVRSGESVQLAARPITVTSFVIHDVRHPLDVDVLDVDVSVECSSGTYVRALARDLGLGLGVGGHLTALRRTRVGSFALAAAQTMDELEVSLNVLPVAEAVDRSFPRFDVDEEGASAVRHGRSLEISGARGPTGVFGPDGEVLALMATRDGRLRVLVGLAG